MFEEWLSEVQFGFFVCFKPYILLDYSFIDEIVDIFKEKSHTFLFINFRGREILAGGGKSQGAPPPLCMKPCRFLTMYVSSKKLLPP